MSCTLGTKCYLKEDTVNEEAKSVEVILSDETEIVRYSWEDGEYFLTLSHDIEAVNLERAEILSLFINHDTYDLPVGKFTNVRLEDKKLKATAMFDEDDNESMKIFNKLKKGFLQSFSVGVNIDNKILTKEEDGKKYYTATQWSLNEASVVGIPAIPNAKVGLSKQTASAGGIIANLNTGADMKFDGTEEQFNALMANKTTMESRNETLKVDLQTKTTALEAKTDEMTKLAASHEAELSEANEKLESFKTETTTRVQEGMKNGASAEAIVNAMSAETPEEASKIIMAHKESGGQTQQTQTQPEGSAWDNLSFGGKK